MKHIGMSYSDIKTLTRSERATFIQLLTEEMQREKDAINK
tara:strand:+ start:1955 stop:2074 length:120 start_codon:yes stop_codon:yes gene_type:complete